jgi:hypothetical protein
MNRQVALTLLTLILFGMALTGGAGIARAQAYSSYVAGTQIHATANHWGNSPNHHLLDTITITTPLPVSRASWNAGNVYTSQKSMINIYDAGLHCLLSPGPLLGGCLPGMLYTHTGPLLSAQTNPQANAQISVLLVADQNTVCASYPCTLPVGTYSLTSGSSEVNANTMTLWGDGSGTTGGGTEFHIANSFGDPGNAFIAGYVQQAPSIVLSNGNTQVTLTVTMLNGQAVSDKYTGFAAGMRILIAGLTSGAGGQGDPCNGYSTVNSVTATTITYTVAGASTCALEGKTDGTQTCNGLPAAIGAAGYACVAAGLPPTLGKLIALQQNPNRQPNGYYCYVGGTAAECQRNNFVGPGGPQSGAHSIGIIFF